MRYNIFWIQTLFRLWFGVGWRQSKCSRAQRSWVRDKKVTLWVAQRLYITAIWVKTGRVVKRLVCSVIGVDIRALDWLDLEGQIFHMSEGDHIGEPDYSFGFIKRVVFCEPSVSNTCTHECAFDTWSNAHTLWRSAYWSNVLGAMFGTREGRGHIWI